MTGTHPLRVRRTPPASMALLVAMLAGAAALPRAARAQETAPDTGRPPRSGELRLSPVRFRLYDGREVDAELGALWVPERRGAIVRRDPREALDGRLVKLGFVRLKTDSPSPGAPVVWLSGGPGVPGVAMARVPVYFRLFERLREQSDVILLDQRGSGSSEPELSCGPPAAPPAPPTMFESERLWLEGFDRMAVACHRYWTGRGVDVAAYTTEASADDVDDLRRALGAPRVSLLGHSYGTVLAQEVLRRHGDRVERAVLAAVDGPDHLIALPGVWDLGFRKLAALAARDSAVGADVADLEALYRAVLDSLDRRPVSVTVRDARAGRPVRLRVGAVGVRWLLRTYMADARTYARIPALLHALRRGDVARLAPELEALYNGVGRSAMATAMDCSAGWSAERFATAQAERRGTMFATVNLHWESDLCRRLGLGRRGPRPRLFSSVPTLFLSGTLDANTPPFQAEEVRWGFPRGVHVVVENGGHETLPAEAVQALVADFLRGADVRGRVVAFDPPTFEAVR